MFGYYCKKHMDIIYPMSTGEEFDVAVIGGGSAGIQFSLDAADLGLKVILFDYVSPSKLGNTWGLGGTCVNVGCIPKKLLHIGGQVSEAIAESHHYGQSQPLKSDLCWSKFSDGIRNYIRETNFQIEVQLMQKGVKYVNTLASIKDRNTIVYSSHCEEIQQFIQDKKTDNLQQIKCKYIVIAAGGRPSYDIDCPGAEKYAITSDDIFWQKKSLGKTLVIGGGYIALELAGILGQFGQDVTLMTRGDFLRGFDHKITEMVLSDLQKRQNIKIKQFYLPLKIESPLPKQLSVDILDINNQKKETHSYENVILAVGRKPNLSLLNLEVLGVEYNKKTNKIICRHNDESTSVEGIYAIGDVTDGRPELTSVAVKSARVLALKIYKKMSSNAQKIQNLDYSLFPTTLFTPIEYSFCGLTEGEAVEQYGPENISIYHSRTTPLEQTLIEGGGEQTPKKNYFKVICDKKNSEKVLGLHLYGQNSGEIMQGFYMAMNTGMLNFALLSSSFGIHPTSAEEFTNLRKEIDQSPDKDSC